jgi:hypothetical protein
MVVVVLPVTDADAIVVEVVVVVAPFDVRNFCATANRATVSSIRSNIIVDGLLSTP